MIRRILAVASALFVTGGAVLAFTAPAASAAELGGSGWWWRATDVNDGAPKPPNVPDGGLYVAGTPDGASAIAAVRFTLDEFEKSPKLVLEVASPSGQDDDSGSTPATLPTAPDGAPEAPSQTKPVILACQAGDAWKPADGGKWKSHPDAACGIGKVFGDQSADGKTWTWDLSSLQLKTKVDVVLVPGKIPGTPGDAPTNSTFQMAFDKPSDMSLETQFGTPPPPPIPPGSGAACAPAPSQSDTGASSGSATVDAAGASDTSSDYSSSSFDPGVDTSDDGPALDAQDQGLDQSAPAMQNGDEMAAGLPATPASSSKPRNNRLLGGLIMAAGLILGFFTSQQPMPAPRKLGRFGRTGQSEVAPAVVAAGPPQGGLGRFVRPRSGPAPRL